MGRSMEIGGLIIAALLLIGDSGCFSREAKGDEWKVEDLRAALTSAEDPVAEYCRDFSLTARQVRTYFQMARPITYGAFDGMYSFFPCMMTGRLVWPEGEVKFEISVSLVGVVFLPETRVYLVCDGLCEKTVL